MENKDFEISNDVPLPMGSLGTSKYPYNKMDVGSSFSFPEKMYNNIQSTSRTWALKNGWKFKVSKVSLRIWRVS